MALLRTSATVSQRLMEVFIESRAPTRSPDAYDVFNGVCKFKEDSIDLVKTSKHRDHFSAWISVSSRQDVP